jgi:hypothetical protein
MVSNELQKDDRGFELVLEFLAEAKQNSSPSAYTLLLEHISQEYMCKPEELKLTDKDANALNSVLYSMAINLDFNESALSHKE